MECHILTYPVSRNRHFSRTLAFYCGNFPARFLIYYVLNRVARPQSFLNKISSCLLICWLTCRSPKRPPCCRDDPRAKMVLCYVTCPRYHIACCCMSSKSRAISIRDSTVLCRACTFLTDIRVHLVDKMRTKTQIVPSA